VFKAMGLPESVFVMLCGLATATAAQWPETPLASPATASEQPAKPMTLAALVAAYDQARGGARAWSRVKNVQYSGTLTMAGLAVPFSLDVARPGKLRMAMQIEGGTVLQVYDGKRGWTSTPSLGQAWVQPVSGEDLKALARQADLDGHLIDAADKGYVATFLGPSVIGATEVYGVELKRPDDGSAETHYLDARTFLPVQLESTTRVQGLAVRTDVRFSDYRAIEDRQVPFATENVVATAAGIVTQQLKLDRVQFNVRFPRGHFDEPAVGTTEAATGVE
jgi:outer membrane lipoprotein-sorting protein